MFRLSSLWQPVVAMTSRRSGVSESIFTTELSSAERYSPQFNSWQPVLAMTSRRSGLMTQYLQQS